MREILLICKGCKSTIRRIYDQEEVTIALINTLSRFPDFALIVGKLGFVYFFSMMRDGLFKNALHTYDMDLLTAVSERLEGIQFFVKRYLWQIGAYEEYDLKVKDKDHIILETNMSPIRKEVDLIPLKTDVFELLTIFRQHIPKEIDSEKYREAYFEVRKAFALLWHWANPSMYGQFFNNLD